MKSFSKKQRLLHWDSTTLEKEAAERRKKEWKELYADLSDVPSADFLEREYENDLSFYYRKWDDFLSELDELIKKDEQWEHPRLGHKFYLENGKKLLKICALNEPQQLDVYNTQKKGLILIGKEYIDEEEKECLVLPACKEGYHREWEHDGICVR